MLISLHDNALVALQAKKSYQCPIQSPQLCITHTPSPFLPLALCCQHRSHELVHARNLEQPLSASGHKKTKECTPKNAQLLLQAECQRLHSLVLTTTRSCSIVHDDYKQLTSNDMQNCQHVAI